MRFVEAVTLSLGRCDRRYYVNGKNVAFETYADRLKYAVAQELAGKMTVTPTRVQSTGFGYRIVWEYKNA